MFARPHVCFPAWSHISELNVEIKFDALLKIFCWPPAGFAPLKSNEKSVPYYSSFNKSVKYTFTFPLNWSHYSSQFCRCLSSHICRVSSLSLGNFLGQWYFTVVETSSCQYGLFCSDQFLTSSLSLLCDAKKPINLLVLYLWTTF